MKVTTTRQLAGGAAFSTATCPECGMEISAATQSRAVFAVALHRKRDHAARVSKETREAAIRLLDNSLGQILATTKGVYLDGWPVEERRPAWELNPEAMLVDTWASAIAKLCTEASR